MANLTGQKFGGRIKGTPNRTTAQTKELLQKIVNKEIDNLSLLLAKLEPNERVNALAKLLPYIVPKQSEVFTTDTIIEPITFTVIENKDQREQMEREIRLQIANEVNN